MRIRTLRIWKKGKPVWLFLLGWALCSALFLFALGQSLLDPRGGLPKIDPAYAISLSMDGITCIDVQGEGIRVEISESYHVKELKAQIYGEGYEGQRIIWKETSDGTLKIGLAQYPVTANAYGLHVSPEVVLRLVIPKQFEPDLQIHGTWLEAELHHLKAQQVGVDVLHGEVVIKDAIVQQLQISSQNGAISLMDSSIGYFTVENQEGDTCLRNNRLQYYRYNSLFGNLTIWSKQIQGIWELDSRWGEITIGTKKIPRHLSIDAKTEKGLFRIDYDEKSWKAFLKQHMQEHSIKGVLGNGEQMLLMYSETGNITLEQVKRPASH